MYVLGGSYTGGDMSPPYRGCFGNGKIAIAVGREMPLTRPTVARG